MGAAIHADYAYSSCNTPSNCTVSVIDLADRGVFRVATRLSRNGRAVGAPIVAGDVFYLPLSDGVEAFDASNPEKPEFLSKLNGSICGGVKAVSAKDDVMTITGRSGILKYSISDPFSPVMTSATGSFSPSMADAKVASVGDFVIFPRRAAKRRGFELVSARVAGGTNIAEVSSIPVEAPPTGFAHGSAPNLLFYADGLAAGLIEVAPDGGLLHRGVFFSATDPSCGPLGVACDSRGLVVLACRKDGVRIFSAREFSPGSVAPATVAPTGGDARSVAMAEGRLYVADGTKGVSVISVDRDGLVSRLANYALPLGAANAIAVDGATAFAACEETMAARLSAQIAGWGILREMARGDNRHGRATDVALFRRGGKLLAAIADGNGGVAVANLSDCDKPSIAWPHTGNAKRVTSLCVVRDVICAFDPDRGISPISLADVVE